MPKTISLALSTMIMGGFAQAQDISATYSQFGTPGLLDMPTAQSAEDGTLAATLGYTDGLTSMTLTYQVTARLSGSVRYAFVDLYGGTPPGVDAGELERGFDLRYRFNDETTYLPSVAIGLRDFLTPGRLGSEYLVASKTIGDDLVVTAGLGWGAMGTRDGLDALFGSRPVFDEATPEGQLASDQWFQDDAAFFGGLEYQINDTWGIKAEYSSIEYQQAAFAPAIPGDSPYNIGLTYQPRPGMQLGLAYLYGNQIALSGSFALNANDRPGMGGRETAPVPVRVRPADARAAATWDRQSQPEPALRSALSALLEIEGITLTALEVTDKTARVRYVNDRYRSQAQAMGRVARMMSQVMPGSVQTFVLEPEARGIPMSATTIARADLEQLENRAGGSDAMRERAQFDDAGGNGGLITAGAADPRWAWGVAPYVAVLARGSDGKVNPDLGIALRGVYTIRPNLVLSGAIRQGVLKPDEEGPIIDTTPDVQNVRTDGGIYGDDGVPVLHELTLTHFARPGTNLYSRVSVGYLERMFGGVSGELLWKPVDSRLGLGAELNYVAQRDSDMAFGFAEYDYDVVTGHVSAYYNIGNGYHTRLDVGRYLAGDWGATVAVDRELANGWRVGAYVTQTDLSYEDFGDGSYNRGVRITIPQDFLTGAAKRGTYGAAFRTRRGDGGARLSVDGRLYDIVRDGHAGDISDTWGRFWR